MGRYSLYEPSSSPYKDGSNAKALYASRSSSGGGSPFPYVRSLFRADPGIDPTDPTDPSMLRTKRDVEKHVAQLEAKIQSEAERNLKALTCAKLFLQVINHTLQSQSEKVK